MGKWRWVLYVLVVWQFAATTFRAFHEPWTWTANQYYFVIFAVASAIGVGSWAFVWLRGGAPAVKARWMSFNQARETQSSKRFFRMSLVFWIIIALALVFVFNLVQR
jgi:hypothetical protein